MRWGAGPRDARSPSRGRRFGSYAAATDEVAPLALEGRVAPPVFAIVPVWATLQEAAQAVAPEEARPRVVHGDQDILISAPIESGMTLRSRAAAVGVHVKESGTTVVLKTETRDGDDRLLNEQYVTEFYRGITGGTGGGEEAPDHRMPDQLANSEPEATLTYRVAEDQTERYAEASGDHNAFHLDDEAAQGGGAARHHRARALPDGVRGTGGARVARHRRSRGRPPAGGALLAADASGRRAHHPDPGATRRGPGGVRRGRRRR